MRVTPLALAAVLVAAALHAVDSSRVSAQDSPPAPQVEAGASADVLRTRGVSAWRNYVWSLERSRLAQSVAELDRARELNAGEADFTQLFLAAFGHLMLGDAEQGRRAATEVRARAPEFGPVLLLDAFEAILAGDQQGALERLDTFVQVVESAPPDPAFGSELRYLAYLHRGAQRSALRRHGEAVGDFRTAARLAREAGREPATSLLLRQALAHQSLDEYGAATDLIRELLRRDPGNPDLYYNLGLLEASQQHLTEARAWYERTVARRRDHRDAHGKLAFLAWKDAGAYPAELPRARRELAAYAATARRGTEVRTLADVESGLGCYWLAVARHRLDRGDDAAAAPAHERALGHFEAALRHEPGCVRALNSIIQIGTELSWPSDRIDPYREAMDAILRQDEAAPFTHRSSFC